MHTSTKVHASIWIRLRNALRGLGILIAEEISYPVTALVLLALGTLIYLLTPNSFELMILSLAIGIGVLAAAFNFVVEELCDLYSTEYNERIRTIKDVAAGGCIFFIATLLTLLVLMAY